MCYIELMSDVDIKVEIFILFVLLIFIKIVLVPKNLKYQTKILKYISWKVASSEMNFFNY